MKKTKHKLGAIKRKLGIKTKGSFKPGELISELNKKQIVKDFLDKKSKKSIATRGLI
jgi:hypothetical protein